MFRLYFSSRKTSHDCHRVHGERFVRRIPQGEYKLQSKQESRYNVVSARRKKKKSHVGAAPDLCPSLPSAKMSDFFFFRNMMVSSQSSSWWECCGALQQEWGISPTWDTSIEIWLHGTYSSTATLCVKYRTLACRELSTTIRRLSIQQLWVFFFFFFLSLSPSQGMPYCSEACKLYEIRVWNIR